MPSEFPSPALLDTSAVIDLPELVELGAVPDQMAICTITLAELAAGPSATTDPVEATKRQHRLQMVEATFEPIPFSTAAARAYALVHAAVKAFGRQPRGRVADLLIAAVAIAESLPLVTRNPDDFLGLEELVSVIAV